jgi:N-methylhydantoinase B
MAGAGGWGDPQERDPARIAHDIAEGKLSPEHAVRVYGGAAE